MTAIVFFFIAGCVMISTSFIAIGSIAASISKARGFIMPNALPLQMVLANIDGIGIATWELIGAEALLMVVIIAELVLVGRMFRASLLASGQKPTLATVLHRMRRVPGES